MNLNDRRSAERIVGALYKRAPGYDLSVCAYCGDLRQCLDHVPPISVARYLNLDELKEKLLLYPSCTYCNSVLGKKHLFNYAERLHHLYVKTLKRIKDENRQWTTEELKELGPNLRGMVEVSYKKQQFLIAKYKAYEERICQLL
jgi:hypothetical protein